NCTFGMANLPKVLRQTKPFLATRPELFTQQIILSDGATYTMRTTSPKFLIKLIKDTRNHPLWNPTTQYDSLDDESGQLSKFTKKFGNEEYDLDFMSIDEPIPMNSNEGLVEKNEKKMMSRWVTLYQLYHVT
ncbi:1146_t:CDS:1, partial [Scutellospora calospora]